MSFISSLIPTNLNEEKEKFFQDNSYNPQFIYEDEIDKTKLYQYGQPQTKYLDLAQNILKKAYLNRNEQDLFMMEGHKIDQPYIEKTIHTFLQMHQLKKKYKISWSSSFISRTSITNNTIKLRLPLTFRKEGLLGMLYHEIGTHALRNINYQKQPWYKKKKKYGFSSYLKTEEGLAVLHALIPHSFKSAYITAIRYLTVYYSQQYSFTQTWQKLKPYIQDEERRWVVIIRQKRGLTDTSKPGGFTKDLVYFEGLVDVYHYLKNNNFDITNLYFGKLAIKDIPLALQLNPNFIPQLPSFFSLDRNKYAQEIQKIGKFNDLDQVV